MMTSTNASKQTRTNVGDAAARGLAPGLIAGVAMALYLVFAGLLAGIGPAELFSRFGAGRVSPAAGVFSHLAVSVVYGAVGGVLLNALRGRLPAPAWLLGLAYSAALYLIAQLLLHGAASPMLQIPNLHLLVAHLLYGLTFGWLEGRAK